MIGWGPALRGGLWQGFGLIEAEYVRPGGDEAEGIWDKQIREWQCVGPALKIPLVSRGNFRR